MSSIGTIDDIIRNLGNGAGWDFFDRLDPEIRKRIEPALAKRAEDAKTIAGAWSRFAGSPDGALAIQALLDTTLFRTVWFVDLGGNADAMTAYGAFREGQNALAHEIVRQIAAGRETEDPPKPRET